MPNTYDELLPKYVAEEFCYQRARINNALAIQNSLELDILYRIVAREMANLVPPFIIPYVEITISPQCTLHCKHCANLMPLYRKPKPMDLQECLDWSNGLLESVDFVLRFRVMGGEPFLQRKLPDFLDFLINHPKINNVQVVTNGTLLIPKNCIEHLQKEKASIYMSNYGKVSDHYDALLDQAKEYNITVESTQEDMIWRDMGDFHLRTQDPHVLQTVYHSCHMNCRHIWNGEFHVCPRSAHGKALGLFDVPETDYVPLTGIPVQERRDRLRKLYEIPFIRACAYCNATEDRKIIPCALQN